MTGLEKIKSRILETAQKEADAIIEEANRRSEEILGNARSEAEKVVSGIRKKSASDIDNYKRRVSSSNDLYRRTEVLKSKQAVIAEVIEKAYQEICDMDRDAYFDMLEKMIEKYALADDGEICFSGKDLEAMPLGFGLKISKAAKKAGGTLVLSKEGKNIENGFILVYGGIEENCTIRALFDAKREEMQDTVNALLYGKEA